jgi:hypothetical protein
MSDSQKELSQFPSSPQCENCDFYNHNARDNFKCSKHRFVMPLVDWQIVCRDWMYQGEGVDFSGLQKEALHYYSEASGELIHAPLKDFKSLKRMMLSVRLRRDEEFGWIISVGKQSQFFPAPGNVVTINISRRKCKFQVVNTERNLAVEMIPNEDGTWQTNYHTQRAFMLYSIESPQLLHDWLNAFMDVDELIKNSFVPSVFAFLEVVGNYNDYHLYADSLVYGKYMR